MKRLIPILCLLSSCSFNPPPNTGAYDAGIEESKPHPPGYRLYEGNSYRYHLATNTNTAVTNRALTGQWQTRNLPPLQHGSGPPPLPEPPKQRAAMGVTNAVKAMAAPFPNPEFPKNVMLSRISTTDEKGKVFTAELELVGDQTIKAGSKMAVVIFALAHTNYTIQVSTNLTDWTPFSSGVSQDTNGAIVIVDLHEGTSPLKFYRQVETK